MIFTNQCCAVLIVDTLFFLLLQDLLLDCMHPDPKMRFPFTTISDALIKLSRRKTPISQSPSFPTNLSHSSETVNFLKDHTFFLHHSNHCITFVTSCMQKLTFLRVSRCFKMHFVYKLISVLFFL